MNDKIERIIGPADRASEIRAVAVSTINGSASVNGTSGALGNDTDTEVFLAARQWADVIVVGAGTARAEDYGPVQPGTDRQQQLRAQRGQAGLPTLALVTRSMKLSEKLLSEPYPVILAPDDAEGTVPDAIEVIRTGTGTPTEIIAALRSRGFGRIDIEGGPGLWGAFAREGLIDVLQLTVDPTIAVPVEKSLIDAHEHAPALRFDLEHIERDDDSTLFLRYRRTGTPNEA